MKRTLSALIILLLLPFANPHAAVTISVSENGADVVAATSGTLNLDGLDTGFATTIFDGFVVGLNDASVISTGVNPGTLTRYLIPGTPLPFMVDGSPFVESDLSSGTMVEIRTQISGVTYVSVPEGYQSGTSIDSTSTWQGTTIAGLGLVPGTYVFDWDTGEAVDSLTLNIEDVSSTPALTLDKTSDVTTYGAVSDVINYSYLVTSSGTGPVAGPIVVTDDMVTVTCPAVNTVGNNDDNLDPAEALTCTASYSVVQGDIDAGSITNTASASGDAGATVSNSDQVTVAYEAPAIPALTLDKTSDVATYGAVSDVINYSYLVTSSGTGPVAGPIVVTDDMVTVTCPAVNTVGNNDDNLDPAEALTCTASYSVVQGDIDAGSITNTASASGDAGATVSNSDQVTVAYEAPPVPISINPIPTISQWAVILLTLLLALPGIARIRARQRH